MPSSSGSPGTSARDSHIRAAVLRQLLDRIDKDHNGEVDLDEFVTMAAWRLHLLAKGIKDMSRASQADRTSRRFSQKMGFFNMRSSRAVAT